MMVIKCFWSGTCGVDIIGFHQKGDPEIFGIGIYYSPHNWRVSLSMVPEMNSFRVVAC
jgi:hypothetical protein